MNTTSLNTTISNKTPSRKVLLFASEFDSGRLILRHLKKGGHIVVETVDEPDELLHEIARTTPHILVGHVSDDSNLADQIHSSVEKHFPDLPVCLIKGDLANGEYPWQHCLDEILNEPIEQIAPRPYADGSRIVLHDKSLHAFWTGKLNRPQMGEGWQKECSYQEARFVLQLQAAKKNHGSAKIYFECLVAQQDGLDQELAYRLCHGSYKALSWSRDLAAKWLGLLAHYVSDVEAQYLPLAVTPGPNLDYVHHDMPIEGIYAATLILVAKVKPAVAEVIKDLVTARFEGEDDNALIALSIKLYGIAKFLEQVGTAQVQLMDAWMDPTIVDRIDSSNIPRGEHRNAGIYRDFYDLTFIIGSPEPLDSVLKGFHNGSTYVQQERFFPSFAEFKRLLNNPPSGSPQ